MIIRSHGKSWKEFDGWCQARGLKPIPTHAWTLAAFIRWCEPHHDYATIVAIIRAISCRHLIAGHSDPERYPMVKRTLAVIERSISNSHHRSALFDDNFMDEGSAIIKTPGSPGEKAKRVLKTMRLTPKLVRRKSRSS
jgi:hypothetical protein